LQCDFVSQTIPMTLTPIDLHEFSISIYIHNFFNSFAHQSTPDEALLEKMLSTPFQVTLTNPETGEREIKSIVLADQKPFHWKELLIPCINLNSYSTTEKQKLTTLEFNLFPYKDLEPEKVQQGENHLFGLVIHMFHELGLIKEFRIPETTLWR